MGDILTLCHDDPSPENVAVACDWLEEEGHDLDGGVRLYLEEETVERPDPCCVNGRLIGGLEPTCYLCDGNGNITRSRLPWAVLAEFVRRALPR